MSKYRSMQGKEVDMDKLMRQNELMPAIGNIRVNARGDELGRGGTIVKKREDVMAEYYENNPKANTEKVAPVQTKPAQVPPTVVGHGTNSKKSKTSGE
jgi:hypothetical protein